MKHKSFVYLVFCIVVCGIGPFHAFSEEPAPQTARNTYGLSSGTRVYGKTSSDVVRDAARVLQYTHPELSERLEAIAAGLSRVK